MGKFLVGVGNVNAYNTTTGALVFSSKAMLNTAIDITTSSSEIEGGQGSALQYIYYYGARLALTLEDTQWNLNMVSANIGTDVVTGEDIWTKETVTLGAGGTGTVSKTPLVTASGLTDIYGWVDGTQVTFSGSNFTLAGGVENQVVCVEYFANDAAARSVEIPANFVPSALNIVIDCQLASNSESSASGASIIGKVEFNIANAQLSGAQTISMSSTGVSTTPLTAMALAVNNTGDTGCTGSGLYGKIKEIIYDANWYDNVIDLAIENSDVELAVAGTETLIVRAIPETGSAFRVSDYSDLTFATLDAGVATVDTAGVVTGVSAGDTNITVAITAKPAVDGALAAVEVVV